MNISEKRYPYPVLTPNGDDYEGSSFDVAIEVVKSPEKVSVKFIPTLKDNGLKRLIGSEQAAKIICHVKRPLYLIYLIFSAIQFFKQNIQ